MRNTLASSVLLLLLICCGVAHGQTKVNPQDQILWPGVTSFGIPSPTDCDPVHYGMPWTDTLHNDTYFCSTSGWIGPFNKGTVSTPQNSHTLAGCGVNYTGGLSFTVGACSYLINGVAYNSPLSNITLAVGSSQDRIDVLAVDNTGTVVVLQGTPNTNPQQPTVDPATQLELTFVYVPATATTIPSIRTNVIFDEGTESGWTDSFDNTYYKLSTTNPFHLTHDIEATLPPINSGALFQSTTGPLNLQSFNSLVLYIRSKGSWTVNGKSQGILLFWAYTGVYPTVGVKVYITDGKYGFDSTITDRYQQIVIPVADFNSGFNAVQDLVINSAPDVRPDNSPGFYIDFIQLQSGLTQPTLPTTLMNFKWVFNPYVAYNTNDVVVSSLDSSAVGYIAIQPTQQPSGVSPPLSNTSFWLPLGQPASSVGTFVSEQPTCSGTTCTLTYTPLTFIGFQRNGLMQAVTVDYTISGNTITLSAAATAGDLFYAQYYH